mmetsp:Transcript_88809/g.276098  ORF Transcript_88809/g.276098 Transcript_88809/m.276098 type:complete len:194 (-) Transcript_88809:159-740(-)
MEPIPVFDSPGAIAATWSQTEESVTITVPLPASAAAARPEVLIRPHHLTVRCRPAPAEAEAEEGEAAGVDATGGTGSTGGGEEGAEPALRVLLDNDLSGEVAVEESAWTANDGALIVELSKRPSYAGGTGGTGEAGVPPKCLWWPCAVRGGKKGPEDPKAPPRQEPNIQRLDSKIGAQAQSRKDFQGKSKFQW